MNELSTVTKVSIRRMESGRIRMSFVNGFSDEYFTTYDDVGERINSLYRAGRELHIDDTVCREVPQIDARVARNRCGRPAGPYTMRNS